MKIPSSLTEEARWCNNRQFGDHRIAMAFSLLGAAVGNTVIDGAECVSKTYTHFWQTLEKLGAKVEYNV
jgi:5-enolpyruvylshikimate-3-phosphate synthase